MFKFAHSNLAAMIIISIGRLAMVNPESIQITRQRLSSSPNFKVETSLFGLSEAACLGVPLLDRRRSFFLFQLMVAVIAMGSSVHYPSIGNYIRVSSRVVGEYTSWR